MKKYLNKQEVQFVHHLTRVTPFARSDAFQFRKDRPLHWLQKTCLFILRKLGANYLDETVEVERHFIDSETFVERLLKQYDCVIDFFRLRPTKMLIGAKEYVELMRDTQALQILSFRAEYGLKGSILEMEVQVIPWMSGVLVLPSEKC